MMTTAASTLQNFRERFGTDGPLPRVVMAPGRVNLLGDHTDYNDGFVLPMTVDWGVYVAVRARRDQTVRVYSVDFKETLEFNLESGTTRDAGHWSSYVAGVIQELKTLGHVSSGFEAVVHGDLPQGAGLSSSAALEVAFALGLQQLFDFPQNGADMALLCQRVEHKYAGVACGIMDQFASRLGRKDHALFLDCRELRYEHLPLDLKEFSIVIVHSGVGRALAGSGYNERRQQCEEAVALIQKQAPHVRALRDVTAEMLQSARSELSEIQFRRAHHVVTENDRVVAAQALLRDRDLAAMGRLMTASHMSLRDDYEVSHPKLDQIVDRALRHPGVLGSRMTGAGFGGCTVHLLERQATEDFVNEMRATSLEVYLVENNREAGPVSL